MSSIDLNYKYLIIIVLSTFFLGLTTVYSSVQNENINKIFQVINYDKNIINKKKIKPQTNTPIKFNIPPKLNYKTDPKIEKKYTIDDLNKCSWSIFIPKINILENIFEGTNLNTLEKGVGYFVDSTKDKGNICLAGHNIGITVSPFKNLYKLRKNDILYYKYKGKTYKYILMYKKEIDETDFTHINKTKYNCLTIVTCIAGKKQKRLVFRFNRK